AAKNHVQELPTPTTIQHHNVLSRSDLTAHLNLLRVEKCPYQFETLYWTPERATLDSHASCHCHRRRNAAHRTRRRAAVSRGAGCWLDATAHPARSSGRGKKPIGKGSGCSHERELSGGQLLVRSAGQHDAPAGPGWG